MCGGCNDMGMGYGAGNGSCCHQTADVGHIYHEKGSNLISYFSETLVINDPAVGAGTCNDKFGLVLYCQSLGFIVIYKSVLIYTIGK